MQQHNFGAPELVTVLDGTAAAVTYGSLAAPVYGASISDSGLAGEPQGRAWQLAKQQQQHNMSDGGATRSRSPVNNIGRLLGSLRHTSDASRGCSSGAERRHGTYSSSNAGTLGDLSTAANSQVSAEDHTEAPCLY